jgi:signal transduction histidine kinase
MPPEQESQHIEGLTRLLVEARREQERAEQAGRDAAFLVEAGRLLAASLDDYAGLLSDLARVAVPYLADWCLVRLVGDGTEATAALAHADPAKEALLAPFDLGTLDVPAAGGEPPVLGGGSLLVEGDATCTARFIACFPGLLGERRALVMEAARRVGMHAFMVVPLAARGRSFGALVLVAADASRRYGPEQLALAEALAACASIAVDNARLYREAHRAARTREDFLMLASHELRTPLASLQIAVQALLRRAGAADAAERPPPWSLPLLGAVERSAIRLGALVDDLLDYSYLAGGVPVPLAEEVDLGAVVTEVVERWSDVIHRARCTVSCEVSGPVHGTWDRRWLAQIATHLLTNAAKFGRDAPIEIAVTGSAETARLRVRDHGPGIPLLQQPRLFESLDPASTGDAHGGLGLGLWLVRRMAAGLGGTVSFESTPGDGATFVVELPRRREGSVRLVG